jgi:hypothetical protein
MAQWNKNQQDYLNQERTLFEVFMCADRYGNIGNCGVTTGAGSGGYDAFGRSRTSEPFTLADYSHQYGLNENILSKKVGAASTVEHLTNKASASLIVGDGNSDYVIHQTRMYHHYMPGKSQFALSSFNFQDVRENTVKRTGYFDDRNGVFVQQDGNGSISIVKRDYISGIATDTIINQSDWNLDKLDGSTQSGISLNFTKTQLFATDFQWLGVGRIRCGFVIGGNLIYCHEFNHSNVEENVYWSHPSLPIRCEVRNTDSTIGITSMQQICSTVLSEGGYEESGLEYAAGVTAPITITGSNSSPNHIKCIAAIRLKNTFNGYPNRSVIRLTDLQILSTSSPCKWTLYRVPNTSNVTGGTWESIGEDSSIEYNFSAQTSFNLIGAYPKITGYVAANNPSGKQASGTISLSPSSAKSNFIAQNIDSNDSNMFIVVIQNLTTNADTEAFVSIQWRETR